MEGLRKISCQSPDPSKSEAAKSVRKSPGKKPVPALFDRCCMISDMIARMIARRDHRPCDGDLCSIVSHDPEPAMIGKARIDLIQVDIGSGHNRDRDLLASVLSRALNGAVGARDVVGQHIRHGPREGGFPEYTIDPKGDVHHGENVIRLIPSLRSAGRVFLIASSLGFVEGDTAALSSLSSHLPSSSSCHERQDMQKSRQGL